MAGGGALQISPWFRVKFQPYREAVLQSAPDANAKDHLIAVRGQLLPCHLGKRQYRLLPGVPIIVAVDPNVIARPVIAVKNVEVVSQGAYSHQMANAAMANWFA